MKSENEADTSLRLDATKLLGFRNVALVAGTGDKVHEVADLAFTKRGTETVA